RYIFFFYDHHNHPHLHYFPTRRSSDLSLRRTRLWAGNRETLRKAFFSRSSLLLYSLRTGRGRAARTEARLARTEFRHLVVHRFRDRKSTRLNSSHVKISYAVFCLKKKI